MEQIVVRLKKVLQRCQAENEQLKCAPGPVSQNELHAYQKEIKQLRSELEIAQLAAGSKLFDRRLAEEHGLTKLMREYEKLRKTNEKVSLV